MRSTLHLQLMRYITKIAQIGDTELDALLQGIKEDTEKAEHKDNGEEGLRFYEELLKQLKPQPRPHIPYLGEIEEEVEPVTIRNEKTAAPKGVKDKALWNKIEKGVRKHKKYTEEQIYKVVQKAYQAAGGEYSHKSGK